MKRQDIALIIVVAFIGGIISIFASKAIFAPPKNRHQEVQVVQPITADFPQPSKQFFNTNSIDPTENVTIGQNANTNPFSAAPN